jgi:hypothetical protein
MIMNRHAVLAVLLIASFVPTGSFVVGIVESSGNTVLSVVPSPLSVSFPESFILNVSITDVTMLGAWQVKLLFNPSVLFCTNVTEPPDNILGDPNYTLGLGVSIDNAIGTVVAHDGILSTGGVNGSGTLCQILFNVSQPGISSIAFGDLDMYVGTVLFDSATGTVHIPFIPVNGYVQVNASGFQSNVFQAVRGGVTYNVTIFANSTVSNFNYDETSDVVWFDETGPSGSTGLCTVLVPVNLMNASYIAVLVNGTAASFALFNDGTSRFFTFTYNHSMVEIRIMSTIGGDVNGDRKVDMKDVAIVAYSFGSTPGMGRWNPIADVNGDLKIDMKDVAFVAKAFGQVYNPI